MIDYRVLDSEQMLIRDDYKKREIISVTESDVKITRSLFWEYPKFLR